MLTLLVLSLAAPPEDTPRLRARAALALAFAEPSPPTYAEQYAKAVAAGKPLVVFVGQPVRAVPDCVAVGCPSFPGAGPEAVVVGLPSADGLNRVDLPGRPADAAVRAAARGTGPAGPGPWGWGHCRARTAGRRNDECPGKCPTNALPMPR